MDSIPSTTTFLRRWAIRSALTRFTLLQVAMTALRARCDVSWAQGRMPRAGNADRRAKPPTDRIEPLPSEPGASPRISMTVAVFTS